MKTLTVSLEDIEGAPLGTTGHRIPVVVEAEYTGPVHLTDGTMIPQVIATKTLAGGTVSFEVHASDDPLVMPEYQDFAVTVTVRTHPTSTGPLRRTVKVFESMTSPVALGTLPPAEGLPAKWVSLQEFVQSVDSRLPHMTIVEKSTLTDLTALRPAWPGIVDWWVPVGSPDPTDIREGDIVTEVTAGPAPWAPTDLSGLRVWLSPRDSGASDGGTLASTAPNLASTGLAFAVNGSVTYDADGLGGRPCLVFTGAQHLTTTSLTEPIGTGGQQVTVAFVGKLDSTAATAAFTDGDETSFDFYGSTTPSGWSARRGTDVVSSGVAIDTATHLFVVTYAASGGTHTIEMDDTVIASAAAASINASSSWRVGARRGALGAYLTGRVGDLLVINGTLDPADKTELVTWLKTRHGIA